MTINKPVSYWQKRAAQRMYTYQAQSDTVADDIAKAYIKSTNYINSEMRQIFKAFQVKNGLSEAEARQLIKNLPSNTTLAELKKELAKVTDENAKAEIIQKIDSPAYAHRIGRFEQLQKDIDDQTATLAKFEQNITRDHYTRLLSESFMKSMFDTQKRVGFIFSFSKMDKTRINEILKQNWSGKFFSERIWDREKNINKTLKEELLVSFMTGRGYNKTAKEIENKMSSSAYSARRLVRTESTYISNMADIETYKSAGIEKYKFLATLDLRTSDICQSMDGKVFNVKDKIPGVNLPPMHVHCRSTTLSVIDNETKKDLKKRIARDPETNKPYYVDENMTYAEWKESVEKIYDESAQGKKDISLTNGAVSGIIKSDDRNISTRNMANGLRKPPTYILSDTEITNLKSDIKALEADESVFEFNSGRYTGYNDKTDKIKIRGDVLPDINSQHPRDLMSARAVLAHEYYGHRAYKNTKLEVGSWNDEFRASYMAAKNAPNLSDEDRRYLILDALERAKESGITIKNNDFIRRVLYGY